MKRVEVLETGPLATVQDLGRPGLSDLGVGHSGAADQRSLRLANRLVGNPESAAAVELTLGGLTVRAHGDLLVAVTGAVCPLVVDGRQVAMNSVVQVPAGATLRVGTPVTGLRSYLAVRGGVDVPPVLGSRSTDVLSGIGPDPLAPGTPLPVGPAPGAHPLVDHAPVRAPGEGDVALRVVPGPRADWFVDTALDTLLGEPYAVTGESNRVGMRLAGTPLERSRDAELPSEGMVCGALQVPPSGLPTLFLNDHPVTGGYPVIAVVLSADLPLAAQARPGQRLRFRAVASAAAEHSRRTA
ncbi:biotin-dependent carboxyltransferase family protein [Nocardioides sp. MAHUQ-72]|uniref:5-oxoprolinase subunit C family protein n=1 Tax=unclassified Nocardioides TaxID=2615069 RepID=UPI003611BD65